MKLVLLLSAACAASFALHPSHPEPPTRMSGQVTVNGERLHPVGAWKPRWQHVYANRDDPSALWEELPHSVARAGRGSVEPKDVLTRANVAVFPEGLELWLLQLDDHRPHAPEIWMFLVRDPDSGAVSEEPARLTDRWIDDEEPLVRFLDLGGDGRHGFCVRQFEHNGTMHNADELHYYSVLGNLELRQDLELTEDLADLYSEDERGSIRSLLMRTESGELRAYVWRENPRYGVHHVPHGVLELECSPDGRFEVCGSTSVLGSEPGEQRYDWTIEAAVRLPVARESGKPRVR